ncbi:MAG TPA: hypothetical protein VF783_03840, partial [Terriglobales bacterium]
MFLVGVEFSSRGTTRESGTANAISGDADVDLRKPGNPRQPSLGKVPAGARAARTVAGTRVHAEDVEHRAFSAEESMAELRELAVSAGGEVTGEIFQRRQRPEPATLIGSGKVAELKAAVAAVAPDLVIFDHELTPSQQRNLERELE